MSDHNKCCIPYCVNGSNNKSDIKLYEFPTPPGFTSDPILHKIVSRRKKLWIRAAQLQTKDVDRRRVCSEHFNTGKASDLWDIANVDWIPTKNMPYRYRNFNIKSNNDSRSDVSEISSVYSDDIKEFVNKFKKNLNETSSNSNSSTQPKDFRYSRGDFKNENDIKKIQQLEKKLSVKEPKKHQTVERKTKNIFTANYNKQMKLKNSINDKDMINLKQNDSKQLSTKQNHNSKSKKLDLLETDNKKVNKSGEKLLDLKDKSANSNNKINNTNQKPDEFVKGLNKVIDPNFKTLRKEFLHKVQHDLKEKNGNLNKAFIKLISQKPTFTDNNNVNEKPPKNVISSKEGKKKIGNLLNDNKIEKNSKSLTKHQNILKEKLNKNSRYNENIKKPNDTKRRIDSKPQPLINSPLLNNKNYNNNSQNQRLGVNEKLNKNFTQKIKSPNKNKNNVQSKLNDNNVVTEQLKLEKNLINNKINFIKNNNTLKKQKLTTKTSSQNIGKIKKIIKESMKVSKNHQTIEKIPDNKNEINHLMVKNDINDNEHKKRDKTTVFDFMQMK